MDEESHEHHNSRRRKEDRQDLFYHVEEKSLRQDVDEKRSPRIQKPVIVGKEDLMERDEGGIEIHHEDHGKDQHDAEKDRRTDEQSFSGGFQKSLLFPEDTEPVVDQHENGKHHGDVAELHHLDEQVPHVLHVEDLTLVEEIDHAGIGLYLHLQIRRILVADEIFHHVFGDFHETVFRAHGGAGRHVLKNAVLFVLLLIHAHVAVADDLKAGKQKRAHQADARQDA